MTLAACYSDTIKTSVDHFKRQGSVGRYHGGVPNTG